MTDTKNCFKSFLAITTSSSLLLSGHSYAQPQKITNACEESTNKNAIHCAYFPVTSEHHLGKYIKIKEVRANQPSTTLTFCATADRPIMSIMQNQWGPYQPGDRIDWQFSQCLDEDCATSKSIMDDRFTINKAGKLYSSAPKKLIELPIDLSYGIDCKVDKNDLKKIDILKHHLTETALQTRIDDAVSMLEAIPGAMAQTVDILNQMRTVALDAADNPHSVSELNELNNVFQTLKLEIDKAQRVNTLDGYKVISGGTITITIGYSYYNMLESTLQIPLPATSNNALGITYLDVTSTSNAENALPVLNEALITANYVNSFT